ncbi:MAG: hypothetical protein WCQ81_07135, partial [Bacteroidales bacterium]
ILPLNFSTMVLHTERPNPVPYTNLLSFTKRSKDFLQIFFTNLDSGISDTEFNILNQTVRTNQVLEII